MAIVRVEPVVEHGLRRGRELAAATRTMRGVWTGACKAAHVVADLRRLIQINVFCSPPGAVSLAGIFPDLPTGREGISPMALTGLGPGVDAPPGLLPYGVAATLPVIGNLNRRREWPRGIPWRLWVMAVPRSQLPPIRSCSRSGRSDRSACRS